MPVQRGAPEYVDSNRIGRPPEVPIIAASQFKESPTHDHHRFMQAIEEKVIPLFFGGDEKPDSTTLAFPIDYRPADGGVCPDRCYVRCPAAGIEKVVSGLCARQVETVGMSEETFDFFERPWRGLVVQQMLFLARNGS